MQRVTPHAALSAIALISASTLVIASAGFGAVYACTMGSQHGLVLAVLFVAMAVALEGIKPLAVAYAFGSLRSLALVRGLALALLAAVAIAYSLTSELSLMAGARGDLASQREGETFSAQSARDKHDAAKLELASLAPSRPKAEIEANITKLLAENPKAGDCSKLDGPVSRLVCPQVATFKGEIARTERRLELQATLEKYAPTAINDAGSGQSNSSTIKVADPGSTALATYLGALGIIIAVDILAQWLNLVPVLALEIGSALAVVLVQAVSAVPVQRTSHKRSWLKLLRLFRRKERISVGETIKENIPNSVSEPMPAPTPLDAPALAREAPREVDGPKSVEPMGQPPAVILEPSMAHARNKAANRIVEQLKAMGGTLSRSERGLAKLVGADRSTVRRALHGLAGAGLIAMEASREGTVLRLIG